MMITQPSSSIYIFLMWNYMLLLDIMRMKIKSIRDFILYFGGVFLIYAIKLLLYCFGTI